MPTRLLNTYDTYIPIRDVTIFQRDGSEGEGAFEDAHQLIQSQESFGALAGGGITQNCSFKRDDDCGKNMLV